MATTLRPLTTGQLLDKTFQTYRQNFVVFAGIGALPQGCLLVVQLSLLSVLHSSAGNAGAAAVTVLLFGLVTTFVSLIVNAIATSATTFAVSDAYLEKPTSIAGCFARVRGKIGKVIYTSIEFGLRVGVGILLLVIPGVYWAGKYGLAIPSVVLEDIRARDSFKRSSELTKDSVGRILTIYFLTWILIVIIGGGLGMLIGLVAPTLAKAAGTLTSQVFTHVLSAIVNTVITPVMSIALTLAYYDQRVRKEAFDIENMMTLLGEPSNAAQQRTAEAQA